MGASFVSAFLLMASVLAASGEARSHPVPGASCGPHDRTESVQGETTLAERFAPGQPQPYYCNVVLVGQFEGEGSSADMRAFGDCAYYSTGQISAEQSPRMRHPGVAVLDVSDPQHPRITAYLDSPVMRAAYESLEISLTQKLLIASSSPESFELYDLSIDCRHPILKSSVSFPDLFSHSGTFAPDGRTFYGAKWPPDPKTPPASAVFAIDTSDASHPRAVATWIPPKANWLPHGVGLSKDGMLAYVVMIRLQDDIARGPDVNGLVVLDVSDVQARRRQSPSFRVVSTLFWGDTHVAQFALPVTIAGKQYLVVTDLAGTLPADPAPANACASGNPGHGFARIVDVSHAAHPTIVSKLMLEVDDPANCSNVMHDPTLGYSSYGCSVDLEENAGLLACGYWEAGLRVFDIRDPHQPKEVAYYKPPARRTQNHPGSLYPILQTGPQTGPDHDHTADPVISPQFRANGDIWFNSADNGFQVVRFTDRFKASHPELFRN